MSTPGPVEPVNLVDPEVMRDPFGTFGSLREQAPLVPARMPGRLLPIWLVTRYDDVKAVLNDPRFVNNPRNVPGLDADRVRRQIIESRGIPGEFARYLFNSVLDADGTDHLRLRRLVSQAFTPRRVAELRPRVIEICAVLLDQLAARADSAGDRVVDLIEHLAYPLPTTVIGELVGIPEADRPRWRRWGSTLFSLSSSGATAQPLREIVAYITDLIERRRSQPAGDLLTGLIQAHDEDGDRLNDTELITMVLTLVLAGHETTAHLIGNGIAALLSHPDQLARLRGNPELLPSAVHEILRWCGSVHGARLRYATEDAQIGGMPVRRGEAVLAVLVAANFDPRQFADPQRLDLTRQPDRHREVHLGFGYGPHYCLGAALARQQAEVAFGGLLDRFPHLELAVAPEILERQLSPLFWRLAKLPVLVR